MEIEPKGAKTVRLIYKLFLSGTPLAEIAGILNLIKVPTGANKLKWTTANVARILRNEKYAGDVVTNKSYIEDIFTHRAIKNTGKKDLIYEQEHHDAIITRDSGMLRIKIRVSAAVNIASIF